MAPGEIARGYCIQLSAEAMNEDISPLKISPLPPPPWSGAAGRGEPLAEDLRICVGHRYAEPEKPVAKRHLDLDNARECAMDSTLDTSMTRQRIPSGERPGLKGAAEIATSVACQPGSADR